MGDFLDKTSIEGDGGGKGAGDNIIGAEPADGEKSFEKRNGFENRTFG